MGLSTSNIISNSIKNLLQLIMWSDKVSIYNDGRYGCELFEFIDCNLNGATIDLHIEQDKDDDDNDDDDDDDDVTPTVRTYITGRGRPCVHSNDCRAVCWYAFLLD